MQQIASNLSKFLPIFTIFVTLAIALLLPVCPSELVKLPGLSLITHI